MLQPVELAPEELEELASIIPGREPELKISIPRIPISELDLERTIIPVCEPALEGNESRYVLDCLSTGWISSAGKYIPLFEQAFSRKPAATMALPASAAPRPRTSSWPPWVWDPATR